ncbi:MAG: GTPase ObgE [Candidatus Levybacteria bacterium]|nr:GTPase ObgE [Candidatus Levybacteria bacterium]
MLIDNVTLIVKAGNGGNGKMSFHRNRGGPDGGNGGNGGNIYFQGSNNVNDLHVFRFKKSLKAETGISGGKNNIFGKTAPDMIIYVPLGTRITEVDTGRIYELTDVKTPVLLVIGGKGGRGNTEFKSATNQAPRYAESGTEGQQKTLFLELRLIADIGLIGLPNAGKSSLLAMLTHATPKIGAYPFTTLEPNIGMFDTYTLADIPGLIEGASSGKGLGVQFLKHIEKTKLLLHCIDVTDPDPKKTYDIVRKELGQHNPELLEKPEIILLTKTDLAEEAQVTKVAKMFKKIKKEVLTCSVYKEESLSDLKTYLAKYVTPNKVEVPTETRKIRDFKSGIKG